MIFIFSDIKKYFMARHKSEKNSIDLRRRFQLHLFLFIAIIFSIIVTLIIVFDIFSPRQVAHTSLSQQMERYEHRLRTYFSNTAAQGIHFSQQVAKEIEKTLLQKNAYFKDVADNQELIAALENNTYDMLRDALHIADCSGSFIVLDTTVNSKLPNAQYSRSGTYLKHANINSSKPVNSTLLWTRGIHEIGHNNNHIFHNKWELEFDVARTPFYTTVLENASKNLIECYYYSPAFTLHGTWEKVMLLCVPIVGRNEEVYGMCGLEINSMFFKLAHVEVGSRYERIIGLVAQKEKDFVLLDTSLEFGTKEGYYVEMDNGYLDVRPDGDISYYRLNGSDVEFVGMERKITLSPLSDDSWVVICMVPKEDYDCMINISYLKFTIFCALFFLIAILLTHIISRRHSAPILQGINGIKDGSLQKTNINEIDDLIEYLASRDAYQDADMSAFYAFMNNVKKLSRAETAIFNLYIEGYSAQKISDILHVSINTIKSHNKNIYRKLEVTSRKELLVYAQMMKNNT